MKTPTDEQLLTQHLEGDPHAFQELATRHSRDLYDFVFRFTRSTAAAEDVVQETFLQVHLSGSSFDPSRRLRPWLFTIAANKARDWIRSQGRKREVPIDAEIDGEGSNSFLALMADDSWAEEAEMADLEEKRHSVQRVVDRLPEMYQEVIILGYFNRLPYKEMAEILDIPLGTVKSRLHSALGAFGELYKEEIRKEMNQRGDQSV